MKPMQQSYFKSWHKAGRRFQIESLEPRCLLNGHPVISEFMASNSAGLEDGDGNNSDWIEIHNLSSTTINLANWHLTDDASNLDKWTFPALPQSILSPNEYLIVFASGQPIETYVDPAGYMHTDFRLGASGEYLALTNPQEIIVSEYAPTYPPQRTDVSFGFTSETATLVGRTHSASALVPVDGSLDGVGASSPTWTLPGFDDTSWPSSLSGVGVGYDSGPSGVSGPPNGTLRSSLVGNDLTDPENDGQLEVTIAAGGASGSPLNEEPPRALDNTKNSKWLSFSPQGTYYEMHFDDGLPRIVDRYTISSANDAPDRDPYSWTLKGSNDGVNYAVIDTRTAQDFANRFETRLYEFINNAAYSHYRFDFQTEFGVTGQNQPVAIQMSEIELLSSGLFGYDAWIDLDVEAAWNASRSSVYQRIEFSIDSPANIGPLSLKMQYEDGFVAYLNGTQIAASNQPTSLNWQSLATISRDDAVAVVPQTFDVSAYSGLLVSGTNVLAIHVLNDADASPDLLSLPELTAVLLNSGPSQAVYYRDPTPGAANVAGQQGFVADVVVSVPRGFYETPFTLTLSNSTPGAQIFYTTNGDPPTPTTGLLYSGSFAINRTTVVKAAAFKSDFYPSPVISHTYLFVRDIVSQSTSTTLAAGFPATWGGVSPDYGMDRDVIGSFDANGVSTGGDLFGGLYANTIKSDLKAIPTLSLSMDVDDLFGPNGIYTNSTFEGTAWERATSAELIFPNGESGFQIDAGLRIQGGAFRSHSLSRKHSLRLLFKSDYGPTKLEYPFFGSDGTNEFDTITLRMESNDGYAWDAAGNRAQYARDAFASETQADLGQRAIQHNRVHLYLNGVYWGIYTPTERPDASFSASYYGGEKENWDAFNDGKTIDGTSDSWNAFVSLARNVSTASSGAARRSAYQRIQGNNPDGSRNPGYDKYLDVDNYIDYLLVNFYVGNSDWPHRNWYASREQGSQSTGFKFHTWDAETAMLLTGDVNVDRTGANVEVAEPYSYLRSSEDFRLRFADRAHRALFNAGAMTPAQSLARYQRVIDEIDRAIVAESARWGDQHSGSPYTRAQWLTESNRVKNSFIALRSNVFLNQLRNAGLYSAVTAPVFNVPGGSVPAGTVVSMTSSAPTMYYTTDGSDPRGVDGLPRGTLYQSPVLINSNTTLQARSLQGGMWSALNSVGYDIQHPRGDFNQDGLYNCLDIDSLSATIAAATHATAFDLTGDGLVNLSDRDAWLSVAGSVNLGSGRSYRLGDANLDGLVDGSDFGVWNSNKFTVRTEWCRGNFNVDLLIDGSDFGLWNSNKFTSSDLVLATGMDVKPRMPEDRESTGTTRSTTREPSMTVSYLKNPLSGFNNKMLASANHGTSVPPPIPASRTKLSPHNRPKPPSWNDIMTSLYSLGE